MKNLFRGSLAMAALALSAAFGTIADASPSIVAGGDNYIERTSVQDGNTFYPALTIVENGVKSVAEIGDVVNGVTLTRSHILSERGAEAFVNAAFSGNLAMVHWLAGGGYDKGPDGIRGTADDVGGDSGAGW